MLERWARRPNSSQALALRCRIVLAAAEGEQSRDIAARLGCSSQTVGSGVPATLRGSASCHHPRPAMISRVIQVALRRELRAGFSQPARCRSRYGPSRSAAIRNSAAGAGKEPSTPTSP